jgi:hypothetical protein
MALHHKYMHRCCLLELSIKWTCLHPVFGPPFTPYSLFQWNPQSKDILLNLSMKHCNSEWNAQTQHLMHKVWDSSCTVRSSENIRSSGNFQEKGKKGWNSVCYQNWWFSEFHPWLNANVLFWRFFLYLTLCMTKLGSGAVFFLLSG